MKLLKLIIACMGIAAICSVYTSCSKEIPNVAKPVTNFANTANVQVFNATLSAVQNYVYVDGTPVSGAALSYGGVFPATAYSFIVDAGPHIFLIKDTTPVTTQVPVTLSQTTEAGKSYTIFTYDTITSVKALAVLNNIVIPTDTTCMLRFANFVYDSIGAPNVDVYSFRRGGSSPVFSDIPTTGVTDFIPYAAGLTDTLYVYATGTTSPLIVKAVVSSLTQTRSYTSAYIGNYTGKKSIATFANY